MSAPFAPSSPASATWGAAMRWPITTTRLSRSWAWSTARRPTCPADLQGYPLTPDFAEALARLKPDLVCVATYSDSHADYAVAAMEAGAHVFVEKPLATTVADAERVVARRQSAPGARWSSAISCATIPRWQRLIAEARALGRALCVPAEPQPAIRGPDLGGAQGADADHPADRRLRRALRRRDAARSPMRSPSEVRGMGLRLSRRDRAGDVQLRPFPGAVRGRLARLVRGRLGADDVGHRLLREGRGRARTAPSRSGCRRARGRTTSTPIPRPRCCGSTALGRGRPTISHGRRARPSGAVRPRGGLSWRARSPRTST